MKKTIAVLAFGLMLSRVDSSAIAIEIAGSASCGNWGKRPC
ncbi:MAG TPA: hypothetical protein VLM20_05300 [Methylophilaceae bacterium]|nr:hypothetical protein [Methylophilaceae bacterium]